jgi:dTDP-glucose 4,6-dehydratase
MAKLLVTGGAGFIGANFVHYWLDRHTDDQVIVLDALTYAGNRASLARWEGDARFRFVQGDIRDQALAEQLLRDEAIDTLVHFAAESHVDRSIHGPADFIETNLLGTFRLLEAARAVWLQGNPRPHRFHHVSTDEVYGSLGPQDPAFREDTPYAPNSPYAASKAGSDHLVRAYHHTYGLQVTTSNCSNNFGPYQFPEKLIPLLIVNLLNGHPLPIYGDGRNVRDWLHVSDHCRGIERVLMQGRVGESYNIGANNERTNLEVVELLCRLVDQAFSARPQLKQRFPAAPAAAGRESRTLMTFVTDRPGHDRRYAIDGDRMTRELGFACSVDFPERLRETLDWYIDNEDWWRPLLARLKP